MTPTQSTLIDVFSADAQSRIDSVLANGPFKTTDGFADAARSIAGETTAMTSDHIYAVCILVAFEAGLDTQEAIVIASAIDTIRRSMGPAAVS